MSTATPRRDAGRTQNLDDWYPPVLDASRRRLAPLVDRGDVAPREVAELVADDPLLALGVIRRANAVEHRHFSSPIHTLEPAVMMLGVGGVQRLAQQATAIDESLPEPMRAPALRALARGALAGRLARVLATARQDADPEEVVLAAVLHRLGEMLLWAKGDRRMLGLRGAIAQRGVAPHEAEFVILGQGVEEIGYSLAERWRLPPLVTDCIPGRNARYARALTVMLSAQLSRHMVLGWQDARLLDHLALACELMETSQEDMIDTLNVLIDDFNPLADGYGLAPLTALTAERVSELEATPAPPYRQFFCLAPRRDFMQAALRRLQVAADEDAVLAATLDAAHNGLGLNRVLFARADAERGEIGVVAAAGTGYEPAFNRLRLPYQGDDLVGLLMRKPTLFWLSDGNRDAAWPRVPEPLKALLDDAPAFLMASVFVRGQPFGLIYADRRSATCGLGRSAHDGLARLVQLMTARLEAV